MAENIYQKILKVSEEVKTVEKNMTVGTGGKGSYKAVSDFDVVLAVKKAEAKYGVCSIPVKQELIKTEVMTYTDTYGNQKTQFVDIVKMTVRLINTDDSTDFIEVESYGRGVDPSDKGFGKASTYARKYCLLNAYKIATGEDPDKDLSEEGVYTQKSEESVALGNSPVKTLYQNAMDEVKSAKDITELTSIYNKWKSDFNTDKAFVDSVKAKKLELNKK